MTTATLTHIHTPHMESISEYQEVEYTFCESCDENISRMWNDYDEDRLPMWSEWSAN